MLSLASLASRLHGTMTALITPMEPNGSIDWQAIDRLVDKQLAAGIETLVVNGSTAEAITLTGEERRQILSHIVSRVKGRAMIIAGTGHSSTHQTVAEHKAARDAGADAGLVVTPAYNRPNDEGLWRHYNDVANASDLPIILYNVPSRTGSNMSTAMIIRLASLPSVVGLKDANTDMNRVVILRKGIARPFALLSGDDNTAAAYCAIGGDGLISVASNARPKAMRFLVDAARQGKRDEVIRRAQLLDPFLQAIGLDTNPIPIKAAVAMEEKSTAYYRLPLCAAETSIMERIRDALTRCSDA